MGVKEGGVGLSGLGLFVSGCVGGGRARAIAYWGKLVSTCCVCSAFAICGHGVEGGS